jgi:hypothetical protein
MKLVSPALLLRRRRKRSQPRVECSGISANLRGSARVSPLKGGQISAQGFNPGLGVLMRCALKGHQNPARHVQLKSSPSPTSFSRHFQGAFLDDGYPGLKPWAKILSPFRGEIRARSRKLALMERSGTPGFSIVCDPQDYAPLHPGPGSFYAFGVQVEKQLRTNQIPHFI